MDAPNPTPNPTDADRRSTAAAASEAARGRRGGPSATLEWQCLLGGALLALAWIVMRRSNGADWEVFPWDCVALMLSAMPAWMAMRWRRGAVGAQNPVAATLLTVTFRTMVMLGALGFVAATKWTSSNSFATSLLGCYFLFLVLESGLSIAWYSSLTRVED